MYASRVVSSASPMASQISFILASRSKRLSYADLSTCSRVMPFWSAVCWSRYPTVTFFAHSILPSSGISLPVMMFIKVDLPSPLAPMRPMCSPLRRRKDTSSKIILSPKPWVKCSTFNMLINISWKFVNCASHRQHHIINPAA